MLSDKFVILAALINAWGSSVYAYNTIKGKTKPNRVTWFLWALAPLIAFTAELGQHVGLRSLMTFMVGFGPALILTVSFMNKKSYWRITKLDIFCGLVSLVALGLWLITKVGDWAIALSILSDLMASIPTIHKAYFHPDTEHSIAFRNGAISAGITLLTIKQWNLANYGFPLYILLMCILLYVLIRFRLGPKLLLRTTVPT